METKETSARTPGSDGLLKKKETKPAILRPRWMQAQFIEWADGGIKQGEQNHNQFYRLTVINACELSGALENEVQSKAKSGTSRGCPKQETSLNYCNSAEQPRTSMGKRHKDSSVRREQTPRPQARMGDIP